jgi:hypothetical protein
VRTVVSLNERSTAGNLDHRQQLELAVEAAENGVETFEAKEAADLPESCPPAGGGGEAYGFLFQARAKLSCDALGAEVENLGQIETGTREETTHLLRLLRSRLRNMCPRSGRRFRPS